MEFQLNFFPVVPLVTEATEPVATPLFQSDVVVEHDTWSRNIATFASAEHNFLVRFVTVEIDGVMDLI